MPDLNNAPANSTLTIQCDNAANAPVQNGWVTLMTQRVANNESYYTQLAIYAYKEPGVYVRAKYGGVWSSWAKL